MPSRDLTDMTLVSEDESCLSKPSSLTRVTSWLLRRPFRDLTDVTMVSADILRRLD